MEMVSNLTIFPDKLSENNELREFQLSGSDSTSKNTVWCSCIYRELRVGYWRINEMFNGCHHQSD